MCHVLCTHPNPEISATAMVRFICKESCFFRKRRTLISAYQPFSHHPIMHNEPTTHHSDAYQTQAQSITTPAQTMSKRKAIDEA